MTKMRVELNNNKNANPFYGMGNTLEIYQKATKGVSVSKSTLDGAWREANTDEKKGVLLTVLFHVGDVTNRTHNIFGSKVDNGGNSQRETFRDVLIPFMWTKVSKMNLTQKRYFLKLITEYTVMDNILANRVQTVKKTNRVTRVINMIDVFGIDTVADYCAHVIRKGTTFQKMCLAKFLTRPRFSKRAGHKTMLPQTKAIMKTRTDLLKAVSDLTNLKYIEKDKYVDFVGYYNWRKEYNGTLESVLFSTGKIKEMKRDEFFDFLQALPANARQRVKTRVLYKDKWAELKDWYTEWETFKNDMQTEQRVLENKIADGEATAADIKRLDKVKKNAKVNVGAVSTTKLFNEIVNGTVDKLKVQPFLDKINLEYNTMVFMDDSGSMQGGWGDFGFTPAQFGAFIATICMMKNPDPMAQNLLGLFSNDTRMYTGMRTMNDAPNALLRGQTRRIGRKPLIDPERHFLDNLADMSQWMKSMCVNGWTNVSSIPDGLHAWVGGDAKRLEEVQRYPVWTLISDGNFNNLGGAASSLNDFMRRCENYFKFRPFLILIDVAGNSSADIKTFSGIDGVMMIPPNPANIEMLLTNFKDMDVYDVYTPLETLSRSKRYEPVRHLLDVGKRTKKVVELETELG
jgi:hypothetical protein